MRMVARCATVMGFIPTMTAMVLADGAAPQTAPMVYTPLMAPEAIVSRPVEKDLTAPKPEAALKEIQFKDKRSASVSLCGDTVSLVANVDGTVSIRVGSREQLLRPVPKVSALQSAHLVFGDTRKYMLAFPTRTGTGAESKLTYRSGAAQVATINGETIWFYDHNTDGVYSVGDDAVRVGDPTKVAVFAPLSSYIAAGAGIYEIVQLAEDGSQLQYNKYNGPTGHLDLKFTGGSAEMNLVIASADGQLSTVVTAGSKVHPPVTLIPGHYNVVAAIVSAPGQGKVVSVLDGASVPSIDIAEGQTTTLELGLPLALEFKADLKSNTQVSIDGSTLKVRGKSGETYSSIQWISQPDVSLVTGGAMRKLSKLGGAQQGQTQTQTAACYNVQIPEIRGHAKAKMVISGAVDGLGNIRGESSLE